MKIVVYFLCACSLLLCGGKSVYAITKNNQNTSFYKSQNQIGNKHLKFSHNDQTLPLINETDLDIEEDCNSKDETNDAIKLSFASKYNTLTSWYSSQIKLFVLNYLNNSFENSPPFLGNSNPIYISQRVLRI